MGHSDLLASPVDEDPLTLALAPPPNETHKQCLVREAAEAEAKKINDEIDEQIKQERELNRRLRKPVKVLVLGQSGSGKSTALKCFQLAFTGREAWASSGWRVVIYLNLVQNVSLILDLLEQETLDGSAYIDADMSNDLTEEVVAAQAKSFPPFKLKEKHRLLQQRLKPLLKVQNNLERRLGTGLMEVQTTTVPDTSPLDSPTVTERRGISHPRGNVLKQANDLDDDLIESLVSYRDDIKELWEDTTIQEMLVKHDIKIQDSPGFFLNDVERIASWNYQPTDDDVIRAQLRTLGVHEHRFIFNYGSAICQEWRMYELGCTRNSRAAWYPYFDDVAAVIFFAPLSHFNERLAEDKRVNRLEDSIQLWRAVCANKLLAHARLVLILNKCDLLQAKLQRGIRIRDSIPSFGDRNNDLPSAIRYFQRCFREIAKRSSSAHSSPFIHPTSAIDRRLIATILGVVEDHILREHMRISDLV